MYEVRVNFSLMQTGIKHIGVMSDICRAMCCFYMVFNDKKFIFIVLPYITDVNLLRRNKAPDRSWSNRHVQLMENGASRLFSTEKPEIASRSPD